MFGATVHGRPRLRAKGLSAPFTASLEVSASEASACRSGSPPRRPRFIPLPKCLFTFCTAEAEALVALAHDADQASAPFTWKLAERNAFFRFFSGVVLIAAPFVVRAPLALRGAEAFPRGGIRGEQLSTIFAVPHCITAHPAAINAQPIATPAAAATSFTIPTKKSRRSAFPRCVFALTAARCSSAARMAKII